MEHTYLSDSYIKLAENHVINILPLPDVERDQYGTEYRYIEYRIFLYDLSKDSLVFIKFNITEDIYNKYKDKLASNALNLATMLSKNKLNHINVKYILNRLPRFLLNTFLLNILDNYYIYFHFFDYTNHFYNNQRVRYLVTKRSTYE